LSRTVFRHMSASSADVGSGVVDGAPVSEAVAGAGGSTVAAPPVASGRGLPAAAEKPVVVVDTARLRTANEHVNVAAMKPREVCVCVRVVLMAAPGACLAAGALGRTATCGPAAEEFMWPA
jgi:hypothetical protein